MRARLLQGPLAARCAAAGLPPATRAGSKAGQAGVPSPARRARRFRGDPARARRAMAHCFTGSAQELTCYLQLGLAIGITGWICDERRGRHLAALMPQIPAERLLLETDAPYLLPRDLNPKPASRRNEPAYLRQVAAAVARARGESVEALARSSSVAARALFGLPEP